MCDAPVPGINGWHIPLVLRASRPGAQLTLCKSSGGKGQVASTPKGFGKQPVPKPAKPSNEIIPVWELRSKACPCGSGSDYEVCLAASANFCTLHSSEHSAQAGLGTAGLL